MSRTPPTIIGVAFYTTAIPAIELNPFGIALFKYNNKTFIC